MRILVAVAVIVVIAIVIATIYVIRHRALAGDSASAKWMVEIKPTGNIHGGKSDLGVYLLRVTPRGRILARSTSHEIRGDWENFEQHLFNAKVDAQNQVDMMNGYS